MARKVPRHRRCVHDVTVAVFEHVAEEGIVAVDDAEQVDLQDPPPIGQVDSPRSESERASSDASVVAQDVDRTEGVDGGVTKRVDRVGIGDIGDDPDGLDSGCLQFRDRGVQDGFFDVAEDDAHAIGGEPFGHGEADPARSSGDHRCLAVEFLHARSLVGAPNLAEVLRRTSRPTSFRGIRPARHVRPPGPTRIRSCRRTERRPPSD